MDLRHLVAFRAVIERGSFSAAAAELGISQPAISAQIRSLEVSLGQRLLDRSGRRVSLTDAGILLDGYARRLLDLADELQRAIADVGTNVAGRLRLGSSTGPGEVLLPAALGDFARLHPDVSVQLVVHDTQTICDMVLADELELGIVGADRPRRGLVFTPYLRDELVAIAPPGHPLADRDDEVGLSEVLAQPMILQQAGSGVRSVVEAAARARGLRVQEPPAALELGLQQSVKAAVLAGLGVTIISRLAVEPEVAEGRLVALRIRDGDLSRDFSVVRRAGRSASRLSEAFLAFATSRMADEEAPAARAGL